MSARQRFRISFAVIAAFALATGTATAIYRAATSRYLYFMPGPLGVVEVRAPRPQITNNSHPNNSAAPPAAAFLTRNIGLREGQEAKWGRHNALTPGLPFSHHLSEVFPPSLYAIHPEFFPVAYGGRLKPATGSQYWNPDLGREDVAAYAAEQARRSFDGNPKAISFSLGINDGLVFGESPETLALTGVAQSRVTTTGQQNQNGLPQKGTEATEDRNRGRRQAAIDGGQGTGDRRQETGGDDPPSSPLPSLPPVQNSPWNVSVQRFPSLSWFRGRPDFSPLVFTFMNRVAADLAKTHPDKYLGCLAYYWCENAPPFQVDPHVIPFLTADRSQSYDPAFRREELELQEKWGKALGIEPTKHTNQTNGFSGAQARTEPFLQEGTERTEEKAKGMSIVPVQDPAAQSASPLPPVPNQSAPSPITDNTSTSHIAPRLGLYDYLDGQGFLVPRVPIHAFAEHIRHARAVGFTDYYGESSRNWGLDGPLPWTIAQLLSDPDRNVDALLDDYYALYFQAAAAPMRRFFARCEEQWMHQSGPPYWLKHYRNESQAVLFPPDVCCELRGLLDDAQRALGAPPPHDNSPLTPIQISPSDHDPGLQKATKETKRLPSVQTTQWIPRQVLQEETEKTEARTRSTNRTEHLGETARSASPLSQLSPVQTGRASTDGIRREILHEKTPATEHSSPLPPVQIGPSDHNPGLQKATKETKGLPSVQISQSNPDADPRQVLQEQTEATEVRAESMTRRGQTGGSSSPLPSLSSVQTRVLLDRVRFVSDSFGVTERFVAFQNARDALARAALNGTEQTQLLASYLDAREEFLRYAHEITAKWPLAFCPINYDDWLRNDPAFASAWQISKAGAAVQLELAAAAENRDTAERIKAAGVVAVAGTAKRLRDVVPNGALAGAVQPGRRIGGLPYGIDLPAPWLSNIEPTENFAAQLRFENEDGGKSETGVRKLRISGAENATVYQWIQAKPGRIYAASVDARGVVSNSDAVMLTVGWLDAEQRPIGNPIVMRLPDRNWPEWVTLRQGDRAPANAAWLGVGLRIMHQVTNDWAELRRFSVLEVEE